MTRQKAIVLNGFRLEPTNDAQNPNLWPVRVCAERPPGDESPTVDRWQAHLVYDAKLGAFSPQSVQSGLPDFWLKMAATKLKEWIG